MPTQTEKAPVVAILPVFEGKILMQLRDEGKPIPFAGHWGYFSGAIHPGEKPEDAAFRETSEELGLESVSFESLGHHFISDLAQLSSYAYMIKLNHSPEGLTLSEGMDMKLVAMEEILSGKIHSKKLGRSFPVATTYYIRFLAEQVMDRMR